MRPLRIVSAGLIVIGLALLALAGGYYVYAMMREAQLDRLAVGERAPSRVASSFSDVQEQSGDLASLGEAPGTTAAVTTADGSPALQGPQAQESPRGTSAGQASGVSTALASYPDATHIRIPSIGVDSKVVELGIVWEKGEWAWQTPDHAVGHHQGTANPGEVGNVVMSGHISSPLKGEGSVFKNLPKIPVGSLIILSSSAGEFAYQVVEKRVVEPTDIWVMDPTPEPILTLITCVPDWVYTHRLVVTAVPARVEPLAPPRG